MIHAITTGCFRPQAIWYCAELSRATEMIEPHINVIDLGRFTYGLSKVNVELLGPVALTI